MLNFLISQRVSLDSHGQIFDGLEAGYTRFFSSLGITLYPVSNFVQDVETYLRGIKYDGLILSGGGDINPKFLEHDHKDFSLNHSPEREHVCYALIQNMLAHKLPIIGICYGMQLLNCYFGGKIVGEIHRHEMDFRKPGNEHAIIIEENFFNFRGEYLVNHYHNHGLRSGTVARCFDIFARDADFDVVEGFIHKELAILGIQWHPERPAPDVEFNRRLLTTFLQGRD